MGFMGKVAIKKTASKITYKLVILIVNFQKPINNGIQLIQNISMAHNFFNLMIRIFIDLF